MPVVLRLFISIQRAREFPSSRRESWNNPDGEADLALETCSLSGGWKWVKAAGGSGKIIQFPLLAARQRATTERSRPWEEAKRRYPSARVPKLAVGRCWGPQRTGVSPEEAQPLHRRRLRRWLRNPVTWKKPQSRMAGNSKKRLQETAAFPHGASRALIQPPAAVLYSFFCPFPSI